MISVCGLTFSDTGDYGEGGGTSVKIYSYDLLHEYPQDITYCVYIDELSLLGDVGDGGGASSVSWKEIYERIEREYNELDISHFYGKEYLFHKKSIPVEDFNQFPLKLITQYKTNLYEKVINLDNIWGYHMKEYYQRSEYQTIGNLLAIELTNGVFVFPSDIKEILIRLMPRRE